MTQINQEFNNNYQTYMEQNAPQNPFANSLAQNKREQSQVNMPAKPLPDIYSLPMDTYENHGFKENIKKNDPMGLLTVMVDHPIAWIGSWLLFGLGMDKFTNACGGKYEGSLLNKIAKFGDKLHDSEIVNNSVTRSIKNGCSNVFGKVKQFFNKSDLFTSFNQKSVQPEWSMAKSMMYNTETETVTEVSHLLSELHLLDNGVIKVQTSGFGNVDLGLKADEIKNLKKAFGDISIKQMPQEQVANYTLLKRLGIAEDEIKLLMNNSNETKEKILQTLGLTKEELLAMSKDPQKYVAKAKEIAKKGAGKIWVQRGNYSWMSFLTKPFKRIVGLDYVNNKFLSMSDLHTKGGKSLAKAVQMMYRGVTFGQGKLGALIFIIPELVLAAINTKKASKDEKIGTAAWGLTRAMTWVITFPLSAAILYGLASMKFAGMSKEAIQKYYDKITLFNLREKAGEFKDLAAYKNAKKALTKELKDLRKVKNQNLITEIGRKIVKPLSMDLHVIKPYQHGSKFGNFFRKIPNVMKNCGAVPLKFILCMFGIQAGLDAILHKGCNTVFGKDYDSEVENENKAKKKEQEQFTYDDLQKRLVEMQNKNELQAAQKAAPDTASAVVQTQNPQAELITSNDLQEKFNEKSLEQIQENTTPNKNVTSTDVTDAKATATPTATTTDVTSKKDTTMATVATAAAATAGVASTEAKSTKQQKAVQEPQSVVTKQVTEEKKQVKRDNYTYIPSQNSVLQNPYKEQIAKYIPSQRPVTITKTFDNSSLNSALRRADLAEQRALEILSGKFGNI